MPIRGYLRASWSLPTSGAMLLLSGLSCTAMDVASRICSKLMMCNWVGFDSDRHAVRNAIVSCKPAFGQGCRIRSARMQGQGRMDL